MGYKEKLSSITTFIFDVDGVLTDGNIFIVGGEEARTIDAKDLYAIQKAARSHFKVFFLSEGNTSFLKNRLMHIGATEVVLKAEDKLSVHRYLKSKYGFTNEETLYVGDDVPDYHIMQHVALSACPKDASPDIKDFVDYQSPYYGGRGCIRDVVEQVLKVQGKWFNPEDVH